MNDRTELELRGLDPRIYPLAFHMFYEARSQGIPLVITQLGGRRTLRQQQELVRTGRSRTLNSAHLRGLGFDVDVAGYRREQIDREFWEALGQFGEDLGLKWGGRWTGFPDIGHFEL